MKILINERLSEHRCKTPEGYLICTDAILARTGKQTYRKNEIFKDSDDETEIEVDRTEDEVFSPQTLASFENKPVTVEHPDEDVNVHNYKEYAVGFVRDVHRGEVKGQPVVLGNLVITDEQTIQEIENGEHTDLSCGYDCDIADEPNPCQRNIRGNHVALCEQGRAGIARIVDSKVDDAKLKLPIGYIETTNSDGFHYITRADHARLMPSEVLKIEEALRAAGILAKQVEYDFFDRWIRYKTSGQLASHGNTDSMNDTSSISPAMKDANHLPAKVKRDLQKFLNHKSTFISNKDYDIAEFVKEFERVSRLWAEFPLKIVRESIKGWFKTGDGMMRKDYAFSIEGYDDRFMVSIYAKPDTYETTELNAYFTDSVKDTRMKVANLTNGYAIVPASRWRKFGLNSEVERFTTNLDEARYIRSSLERNDGISFVIVDVTQRRTADSVKDRQSSRLGDKVRFRNRVYVVIKVQKGKSDDAARLTLRPLERFDEKDKPFEGGGDSYWDIHIERWQLDDSVNDALIPPTKESINKFELLLRIFEVNIDRKGLTPSGRVHYQVRAIMRFDQFVKILHRIDREMDKLGIPMTFNAGFDGKTCTAGIDLDKQYVKDSQRA